MQTRTKKNTEILPSLATHCIYSVTVLKNSLGAMDYSWRGGGGGNTGLIILENTWALAQQ